MDVWIERFNYLKVNVDGRFAVCGIAEMGWQECAKGPPQIGPKRSDASLAARQPHNNKTLPNLTSSFSYKLYARRRFNIATVAILVNGCCQRLLVNGYLSMATCQWLLVNGYLSMATCQWLLVNGYLSMATCQWLLVRGYLSKATCPRQCYLSKARPLVQVKAA